MQITTQKISVLSTPCDLLVLFWPREKKAPAGLIATLDRALGGFVATVARDQAFDGEDGRELRFHSLGKIPAKQILILGYSRTDGHEEVRRLAARSMRSARELGAAQVVLAAPEMTKLGVRDTARAMTEGIRLAAYQFSKFKQSPKDSKKKRKEPQSVIFVGAEQKTVSLLRQGIEAGTLRADATLFARDLVNEPALHLTPQMLAIKAQTIVAASKGKITMKTYGKPKLKRMQAGGILGVAMGSDHPPVLVHLIWRPRRAKKRVALVGKAITFDSGGLSLKPADGMMTMKCDMAGAAAVLGVFSALDTLNPRVEVHGVFAACENMPSGGAIRPGDIVKTMNGKTIEILNTDAEGRVTLADTLHYASKLKPDYLIDLATLTGACVVALGEEVAGFMTNDARLGNRLRVAATASGEYLWELPLVKEYHELVVSKIADVKNIGGKWGGAITAGLFLQEFVGEGIPWAHLDIAGPAFAEREVLPYVPLGGTGFGVRTLLEFLKMV